MRELQLPPRAAALSESMRDLGYSLEAAVADIIDNSISAGATKIDIFSDILSDGPCIAIVDNGRGMDHVGLVQAMRHGTYSPREQRSKDDLGRFGLGLKTASFSQCTKLTVVSTKARKRVGACWNLELVADRDDWVIGILDEVEITLLPFIDRLNGDGTMVLWENLDRLCEGETATVSEALVNEKIRNVAKHLSLVFHRFLNGEIKGKKIKILINYHELEPFDPFCTSNKATQLLNQELIRIHGHQVVIQPYILPYHSKLSAKERDFYNSSSDFLNNQGAYVYRNGRLMSWGDWFRLVPKGEATKLARVKIDFSNCMDELWTIDIKKSRAYPPQPVREQIKKIISKITDGSTRVIKGKGKRLYSGISKPVWLRTVKHDAVEYSLDRQHSIIIAIKSSFDEIDNKKIEEAFSIIESSIPIEAIYADYTVRPQDFEVIKEFDDNEVLDRLEHLWTILSAKQPIHKNEFREIVLSVKPFSDYSKIIENFLRSK